VLAELEQQQAHGEGVLDALSYYTTHRGRMHYAAYRARGLQIGSGSVESACKQLVSARLKQAGMIWEAAGAEQVATVRAWLKSGRWSEALALRAAPRRRAAWRRAQPAAEAVVAPGQAARAGTVAAARVAAHGPPRRGLSAEVLAVVRAELAQPRGPHAWRKAWSRKRQREQHAGQPQGGRPALTA